jgi:hypothetical protein
MSLRVTTALAVLNLLAGSLLAIGGAQEALAQARLQPLGAAFALAALGAGSGMLLAGSGAALSARLPVAARVTAGAAGAVLTLHAAAFWLASPGMPVLLVGVVYPACVLVLLWASPGLGGQSRPLGSARSGDASAPRPGERLRISYA